MSYVYVNDQYEIFYLFKYDLELKLDCFMRVYAAQIMIYLIYMYLFKDIFLTFLIAILPLTQRITFMFVYNW